MRESESIIMQIDIVDSLIHFIKSKYGVRTKAILMYERTEQIPLELLEPYVDLLNKNEMKFIEILSRTDDMVIIRYVDNALLQKKPFYFARNDLFNKYKEENDYFQLSIKNNVWGNMWENEKSIPYVRKLIFQKLGVPYEYEREAFSFDDFIYVPDFFLPNNIIVEVKGFWDNNSRRKVVTLKKNRPEYTILPIDSDMYESLRLKYSSQISQWEKKQFRC